MNETLGSAPEQPPRVVGRPFAKGQSGNPKGYSKVAALARSLAAEATPAAVEFCRTTMNDERAHMQHRVACAKAIISCGHANHTVGDGDGEAMTFIVQQLAIPAEPIPGVTNSPIEAHIALSRRPSGPGEVVDAAP